MTTREDIDDTEDKVELLASIHSPGRRTLFQRLFALDREIRSLKTRRLKIKDWRTTPAVRLTREIHIHMADRRRLWDTICHTIINVPPPEEAEQEDSHVHS